MPDEGKVGDFGFCNSEEWNSLEVNDTFEICIHGADGKKLHTLFYDGSRK